MPIYAFACPDCGASRDHLMKISDPAPACPACGSLAYAKQLSAPAFALKGSGWYQTDFKSKAPEARPKAPSGPDSKASGGSCAPGCGCH